MSETEIRSDTGKASRRVEVLVIKNTVANMILRDECLTKQNWLGIWQRSMFYMDITFQGNSMQSIRQPSVPDRFKEKVQKMQKKNAGWKDINMSRINLECHIVVQHPIYRIKWQPQD
uniref:Retrotransposon protein n=1 Tax=Angiostrongylus cantonensis TaxID=6313 RepID=A0A0K0DE81_ANGCA